MIFYYLGCSSDIDPCSKWPLKLHDAKTSSGHTDWAEMTSLTLSSCISDFSAYKARAGRYTIPSGAPVF